MNSAVSRTAAAVSRAAVIALAVVIVTALASGWLYWLRAGVAHWPRPRVAQALPLDELPGHDSMPLLVYLTAYGVAAVLLGLVGRMLRLDRLTAGLSMAAGTGLWLFAVDAFCLFVVRQVPAGEALWQAAGLQGIYLAAVLAGAGGALLGAGGRRSGLTPALLA